MKERRNDLHRCTGLSGDYDDVWCKCTVPADRGTMMISQVLAICAGADTAFSSAQDPSSVQAGAFTLRGGLR
jgi:hypothetical protein